MTQTLQNEKKPEQGGHVPPTMVWLLLLSIFFATANTLMYKVTLNAYSSPTTNYGFFISQFSTLLYTFQAIVVSSIIMIRDYKSFRDMFMQTPTSVFLSMGLLDSASATLGAIAGVNCPGELQTVLNQLVIPITMVGAASFLKAKFEPFQIWGSIFILLGAIVASSNYLLSSTADTTDSNDTSNTSTTGTTSTSTAVVSVAVIIYVLSVVPSAVSNIYKEQKMKEQDMNEVHTSTLVSFWQLWFGFLYLPLLALPQLGGLTYREMSMQLSDGFTCFLGTNPNDPAGDCSNAAYLLLAYIVVNFFYNILMLAITKRGSAVLLVISQALSLPVTNIAFTLKIFMGEAAEPLSALDLLGLVLVCIGFLTYSGFGLAHNFMVAQGPPGQMAYVHFEDVSEVIVSTELALRPEQLVSFLVSATLQQQTIQHHQQAQRARSQSFEAARTSYAAPISATERAEGGVAMNLIQQTAPQPYAAIEEGERGALLSEVTDMLPSELSASLAALAVVAEVKAQLEEKIQELRKRPAATAGNRTV